MAGPPSISRTEKQLVDRLVAHYVSNGRLVQVMLEQLRDAIHGSSDLMKHVHSTKWRTKDPVHLQDKLYRKIQEAHAKGRAFGITEQNLLQKVTDLAGFRILHLHTQQIIPINKALNAVFDEFRYSLVEPPAARTWDDEHREFYTNAGIRTIKSPKMYTSVHYVIKSNNRTKATCEIQVRTLAEELWGEVDHTMNYPHESSSAPCREQIKVLARITSSCSRLVDSIFQAGTPHKSVRSR